MIFPVLAWAVFLLLPHDSQAQAQSAGNNSIESVFCNIALIMTGTTGKSLGTVGVIGLGIGALFGKVSWNTAMLSVMSIGVIFGAASIVSELGGDGFSLIIGASPSIPSGPSGTGPSGLNPAATPGNGSISMDNGSTASCGASTLVSQ